MKSATTGTVSGCIVWFIAFGVISMCLVPIAMAVGGITSVSDFAINITGGFICPEGTTPETYSYATTTTDEYGNTQPSTAYVLRCVDSGGDIVQEDPVGYAFMWTGIVSAIGLIVAGVLAFALAAPVGVLIARLFKQNRNNKQPVNIEPQ